MLTGRRAQTKAPNPNDDIVYEATFAERASPVMRESHHGAVMRRILDLVGDDWVRVVYLAADVATVFHRVGRPTEESTRRACRRLAQMGLLEIGYEYDAPTGGKIYSSDFQGYGNGYGGHLSVRRPQKP